MGVPGFDKVAEKCSSIVASTFNKYQVIIKMCSTFHKKVQSKICIASWLLCDLGSKVDYRDLPWRIQVEPRSGWLRALPRAYAGRLRTVSLSGQDARRHCSWAVCAVCVGGTNPGKTPQLSATLSLSHSHVQRLLSGIVCAALGLPPD